MKREEVSASAAAVENAMEQLPKRLRELPIDRRARAISVFWGMQYVKALTTLGGENKLATMQAAMLFACERAPDERDAKDQEIEVSIACIIADFVRDSYPEMMRALRRQRDHERRTTRAARK